MDATLVARMIGNDFGNLRPGASNSLHLVPKRDRFLWVVICKSH